MTKENDKKESSITWASVVSKFIDLIYYLCKAKNFVGAMIFLFATFVVIFIAKYPSEKLPDLVSMSYGFFSNEKYFILPFSCVICYGIYAYKRMEYVQKKEVKRVCKARSDAMHPDVKKLPEHFSSENIPRQITATIYEKE